MLHDQDIILIASAPWQIHGKVNCHHIAERLAVNNRVLFVESPGLRMPNLRHGPDRRKLMQRGRRWLSQWRTGPRRCSQTLSVLSPPILPMHSGSAATWINRATFGRAVRNAANQLGFAHPLLWVFLPTGIYAAQALPGAPVLYHCTDDYAGNVGVDCETIERLETQLLRRAALVLATSRPLAERLSQHHPRVRCMPNVAEVERFSLPPASLPEELATIDRPIIGYVGNIAQYMIDIELVAQLAAMNPRWAFVFVGPTGSGDPTTDIRSLRSLPNVHLLGPRAYEQVPNYVHGFDVCITPFARNRVTDSALPLKTFEYLGAGKPVVSTPLAAMQAEPLDEVVQYAVDAATFAAAINRSLDSINDKTLRNMRRQVAQRYSWTIRWPEIAREAADIISHADTRVSESMRIAGAPG